MTITDILAESRSLVDASSTSYPDAVLLRRINAAYEEVVSAILYNDGTWNFDDKNFTTNPIGTATLQEGISSYTFEESLLDIENVKVKDSNGFWHLLTPIDQKETSTPLEYMETPAGLPTKYDKSGNTLRLYPAPSSTGTTLAAGLKITFTRTADFFTTGQISTGTKEPGFAINHIILAYKSALPYALSYKQDRVSLLRAEIDRLMNQIIEHYSKREKDKRNRITFKQIYPL